MAILRRNGIHIKRLLLGNAVDMNSRPYYHGLVGEIKPNKNTYNIIVLSGGGIDSFMSSRYAVDLIGHVNRQYEYDNNVDQDGEAPDTEINLHFMVFDYGQANYQAELHMTEQQAAYCNNKRSVSGTHVISVKDGLMQYIRNPLANRETEKANAYYKGVDYAKNDDYVPNRNARFVFNAAGYAETIGADMIVIGAVGNVNQDNSFVFMQAAYKTILQSNRDCFPALYAPFVMQSKSMVALAANESGVLNALPYITTSCFDANETYVTDHTKQYTKKKLNYKGFTKESVIKQCGICRSCTSLKQAFKFAGIEDPYHYQTHEIVVEDSAAEPGVDVIVEEVGGKPVISSVIPAKPGKKAGKPKAIPVEDEDDED